MILRSYLFRKVTIIGVGLMGGSLGLALKKKKLVKEVTGFSTRQDTLNLAKSKEAIDTGTDNLEQSLKNADLVVLATPVESIKKLLVSVQPHLRRGCIVTDLGSTKLEIVETAEKILAQSSAFVGSHPLVGSEKRGVTHADADLFEDSMCVMTPTKNTHRSTNDKVNRMWKKLGCDVKSMTPEDHDLTLAYLSHMPHLLAFVMMHVAPQEYLPMAPRSLKDATRIASSSAVMWNDICMSNGKNVIRALDEVVKNCGKIRRHIIDSEQKALTHYFNEAKEMRDKLK